MGPTDVVISSDILLAARCVAKGADVLTPTGKELTEDSVGDAVATRVVRNVARNGQNPNAPIIAE